MELQEYFENTEGIGILATSSVDGNVDLALYARPYIIDEHTIAFSMLERRCFSNIQSNPKAAYMFVERGEGYKGTRLYLGKIGEETDTNRIKEIKEQHKKRYSTETADKHLVYFKITETRPLVGGQ
ncbi:MAG: pyridoxamine 5'-phosphate oxidase family protein [Planctomycetota bacterium]